jgi:hypothetical protein
VYDSLAHLRASRCKEEPSGCMADSWNILHISGESVALLLDALQTSRLKAASRVGIGAIRV